MSRFKSSKGKTFDFGYDDGFNFIVGLQTIISKYTLKGTVSLLIDGITARINSTLPYLWRPEGVCDRFQAAFGLTYTEISQLPHIGQRHHSSNRCR